MEKLQRALCDHSLGVLDRLKVACYIWKGTIEERKQDYLLKWTCDEICSAYNKKTRSPPPSEVCLKLWQFLSVILRTISAQKNSKEVEWSPDDVVFTSYFFQSMSEALSKGPDDESYHCITNNVGQCLQCVMTGSPLPSVLFKFELVVSLLDSLLTALVSHKERPSTQSLDIISSLVTFLQYFVYLYGSQGNQKKVFTVTCSQLLKRVLVARRLLHKERSCESAGGEICKELDNILLQLFNKDNLPEFSSALSSPDLTSPGKRTATSYARVLFQTLNELSTGESEETRLAVSGGVPLLLRTLLLQNSSYQSLPKNAEFKFFLKLLPLLDIPHLLSDQTDMVTDQGVLKLAESFSDKILREVSDLSSDRVPSTPFYSALHSLSECLQLLFKYEVYRPSEDKSSGGDQTSFLEGLILRLLKSITHQNLEDSLVCLSEFLKLNHKLVEPWLPVIWLYLLLTTGQKSELFALVCMETYLKLRQLPLLIGKYLEALDLLHSSLSHLQAPSLLPSSPSFTLPIENFLAKQVSSLPPGQCIDILDLFHQYFTERLTSDSTKNEQSSLRPLSLSEPLVISLIPSLEKVADMVKVFLANVPASTWTGRHKEKAVTALLKLHTQVCLPFLQANYAKKCRKRLSSIGLYLTCETSQLLCQLGSLSADLLPSDWLPGLVWRDELQLLVPDSWTQWIPLTRERLGPLRQLLLKRLVIVRLKTKLKASSLGQHEEVKKGVESIFQPLSVERESTSSWTGQIYDIRPDNGEVGFWSLLLTNLPVLYEYASSDCLTAVANGITTVLHTVDRLPDSKGCLTVWSVTEQFLTSEAFLEMGSLQELLLSSTLPIVHTAFPKIYPKPLRKCLLASSSHETAVFMDESLTISLSTSLQSAMDCLRGGKMEGLVPSEKKLDCWLKSLSTSLQLLHYLPLRALCPVSQLRILLVASVWHSALTLTALGLELSVKESVLAILARLNYYLGWVLQCISLCLTPSSKRSKSKRESVSALASQFTSLLDVLLEWLYSGAAALYRSMEDQQVPKLFSSLLVTVEMVIGARIKIGGHPGRITEILTGDVLSGTALGHLFAERWLHITAKVSAKLYKQGSHTDPTHQGTQPSLDQLTDAVVSLLERLLQDGESVLTGHSLVVSSLALLDCRAELMSSRVSAIVKLLCQDSTGDLTSCLDAMSDHCSVLDVSNRLDRFNGLMDVLSLSSIPLEVANDETNEQTVSVPFHTTWNRLSSSLCHIFKLSLSHHHRDSRSPLFTSLDYLGSKGGLIHSEVKGQKELILGVVCEKISHVMKKVVCVASQEQLGIIVESLFKQVVNDRVSLCVLCFCWRIILDCKLKQVCREELRKHFSKIVVTCLSAVTAHSTDTPLVISLVQLMTGLVSIPNQVGLDNQSTLTSLQTCDLLTAGTVSIWRVKLLGSIADLVLAVCRQHSSAATNAPAPVVTALINILTHARVELVHSIVTSGQDLEEQRGSNHALSLSILIHGAGIVSKTLELVSHQKAFCKFVSYLLHEFIVAVHKSPLHSDVKDALLPGVFSLVKLCSPGDIAFIKSPMDSGARDSCQTLFDDYKQYYKFGGRV